MKTVLKRTVSICLCFLLFASLSAPAFAVTDNTTGYFNSYSTIDTISTTNGCGIMQGMAVGSTYMYTVKVNSSETKATLFKTNRNTGETTVLKDSSTGKSYLTYLGHANDMDCCTIDDKTNLFVATMTTGRNSLVRLKVSGSKVTKMGGYTIKFNGSATSMSGVAVLSKSASQVNLLFKKGCTFYTGSVKINATSGTINVSKAFTIDTSSVKIDGSTKNLSSWTHQGFGYHGNTIFVPLWNSATPGQSVIAVYDIENASGTIKSNPKLSFRITSSTYASLFEIESCGICSKDGKLYFNVNRRKSSSDTNHDAVLVFKNYTF